MKPARIFIEFAFDEAELRDALRLGSYPASLVDKLDLATYLRNETAAVVHDTRNGMVVARNEGESLDDFRARCEGLFGKKVA